MHVAARDASHDQDRKSRESLSVVSGFRYERIFDRSKNSRLAAILPESGASAQWTAPGQPLKRHKRLSRSRSPSSRRNSPTAANEYSARTHSTRHEAKGESTRLGIPEPRASDSSGAGWPPALARAHAPLSFSPPAGRISTKNAEEGPRLGIHRSGEAGTALRMAADLGVKAAGNLLWLGRRTLASAPSTDRCFNIARDRPAARHGRSNWRLDFLFV